MSGAVSIDTCHATHEGLSSRIGHIEEHGKGLEKKYDRVLWLLIANLGGIVVLVVNAFLEMGT